MVRARFVEKQAKMSPFWQAKTSLMIVMMITSKFGCFKKIEFALGLLE